jgi:hypothetical protein
MAIQDELPLNTIFNKNGLIWLNDFIAPFTNKVLAIYTIKPGKTDDVYHPGCLTLESSIDISLFGTIRRESSGSITFKNNRIEQFTYENKKLKIEAKCADTP